jgi:hypothetical protein
MRVAHDDPRRTLPALDAAIDAKPAAQFDYGRTEHSLRSLFAFCWPSIFHGIAASSHEISSYAVASKE